ncbi:TPA: hypothetical protein NBQ01_002522 [Corynebacterium striatum]|nr:hypothetical protein [Corynebacterium striatum]
MPSVSGSLVFVTSRPSAVSEVWVRARDVRTSAQGVVVESNDRIPVVGGAVSFEVLPGPAVLTLVEAGRPVDTIPIVVGDAPEQSLMDVVDAALIVDESQASVIESLAAQVVADAHTAYTAAAAAKSSEQAAAGSADSAADFAATAGKADANAAASKNAAARSASDAATSAGNAKKSEDAAKAAQARSEEIASSTSWDGDRLTVNGKTSPSLRGPKGDTGSVENVSWADISDKPAVFPPNTHTHTMVQVTGLDNALAGKTDKAYVDAQDAKQLTASEVEAKGASPAAGKVVRRDSAGQVLVPTAAGGNNTAVSRSELTSGMAGKADKSYVDAVKTEVKAFAESRPAFFSGKGEPPATIPGAVVGDYYLNEASMELHKITGV